MAVIIGMGALSVGSRIVSMILGKMGRVDDASMVEVASTCLMVGTVVTTIANAFAQASRIGK